MSKEEEDLVIDKIIDMVHKQLPAQLGCTPTEEQELEEFLFYWQQFVGGCFEFVDGPAPDLCVVSSTSIGTRQSG